jgi:hypothetical protein
MLNVVGLNEDYNKIQTKIETIQNSMNNFEWNVENYCDFLKHEIEISKVKLLDSN